MRLLEDLHLDFFAYCSEMDADITENVANEIWHSFILPLAIREEKLQSLVKYAEDSLSSPNSNHKAIFNQMLIELKK